MNMKTLRKVFRVGFKGKKIFIKDYILCENIFSKTRGLMFRPIGFKIPLVFIWEKQGRYPIHSFFCRKFLAVWLADGKILEKKVVDAWKTLVLPSKSFDTLIEIPL